MTLLLLSFLAGVLTILAPCILPLLPVIIGGSLLGDHKVAWKRTLVIVTGLAVSVFIFSLVLRASTLLLDVPQLVWQIVSGGIVVLLGLNFLFPKLWLMIVTRLRFQEPTDKALGSATKHGGFVGALLTGAALGPVFTSCSPTYLLILAAILPVSLATGIAYLAAYILGMSIMLLLIAYFGRRITHALAINTGEGSVFRRVLGIVFIIVGISVVFGWDKYLQAWLLELGAYDGTSKFEDYFMR